MPSVQTVLSELNSFNMSQQHLARDTYQANGLNRSHQQATNASSQTSLQKLPASSPQFLYQPSNNNNATNTTPHHSLQFPPPPQSQMMTSNIVASQQHQQQQQQYNNNMPLNILSQQQQALSSGPASVSSSTNLSQSTLIVPSTTTTTKETHQQHNQLLPTASSLNQQQQQQQVPMTTIMIPASAAMQLQNVSMQIQQAAAHAAPSINNTPQILVFMIPYPAQSHPQAQPQVQPQPQQYLSQQPPQIPMTPDNSSNSNNNNNNSLNSTLVRQSHSNSSLMRHSNPQQQQQTSANSKQSSHHGHQHSRAVSSLSNSVAPIKQEPDRFYVKANFSYRATRNRQELSFQKGDILHVLDTLQNTDYGVHYWLATRVKPGGGDAEKGLIPNKSKAEELAIEQRTMDLGERQHASGAPDTSSTSGGVLSASVGRVNFLKRRSAQRSKSLSKDNWDSVVFDIGSFRLPTYERVVYKHPGFCRPIVVFGPLSDIAREKLLADYPEKYAYPTGINSQQQQQSQASDHPKVIRLKGVFDVIDQGKHALLDITAQAVEKLNYVNLAPIVIFMKADSKSIIKDYRLRAARSLDATTNGRINLSGAAASNDDDTLRHDSKFIKKLLEQSIKLEKQWSHVFTEVLDLSTIGSEAWYRKLRQAIENQQSANVWMGEKKSCERKLAAAAAAAAAATNGLDSDTQQSNAHTHQAHAIGQHKTNMHSMTNTVNQMAPMQATNCRSDTGNMLSDRFNDSLRLSNQHNIHQYQQNRHQNGDHSTQHHNATKSNTDLLPSVQSSIDTGLYGNRSQLRNAYAHSLAQKLARASSEPKLNGGIMSDQDIDRDIGEDHYGGDDDDDDEDDDDDDDDDELIKKPLFPNEFENSSSLSSSNGVVSYGQCSGNNNNGQQSSSASLLQSAYHQQVAAATAAAAAAAANYQMVQQQQVKPPAPLPPQAIAAAIAAHEQSIANGNGNNNSLEQQQHQQTGSRQLIGQDANIYSMNGVAEHQMISSNTLPFSNGSGLVSHHNHRDYHLLPPLMSTDNGYSSSSMSLASNIQQQQQHQQQQHSQNQMQNFAGHHNTTLTSNTTTPFNQQQHSSALVNNNTNNTTNDLVRTLDARGSAFHIYSDMNQNSYHYYNLNKL